MSEVTNSPAPYSHRQKIDRAAVAIAQMRHGIYPWPDNYPRRQNADGSPYESKTQAMIYAGYKNPWSQKAR